MEEAFYVSYYRHISDRRWGGARDYTLTVDASIGPKPTDLIVLYLPSLRGIQLCPKQLPFLSLPQEKGGVLRRIDIFQEERMRKNTLWISCGFWLNRSVCS